MTPSPRPGRREQKRSSTRRELIAAGRKLFSRVGLWDSRIEDITEHAGIAKGTLYLHFRNKEALIQAVVAEGFNELRKHVDATVDNDSELEKIAGGLFSAHVGFYKEHPDLLRIFHQVRGVLKFDQPRWRPLRTELRLHIEFLMRHLARSEAQTWSPARRRESAIFLFGCASGTSSMLVSAYPESARLEHLQEHWSQAIGRAVATASRSATTRGGRRVHKSG